MFTANVFVQRFFSWKLSWLITDVLCCCFAYTYGSWPSLFRAKTQHDAEVKFLEFKDKIPVLVTVAKELCNLQSLQKLCDAISQNPSYTVAHLAVLFQLHDHFQNDVIRGLLNTPDVATGMTPVQLAVKEGSLRTVQALLAAAPSLESLDHEGNSVFHFAASSSRDIIVALSAVSVQALNCRNHKGHTPLHMACLADRPECVKALLLAGADVNIPATQGVPGSSPTPPWFIKDGLQTHLNKLYVQDMKGGGTPLHWSCSREVVGALVAMGCQLDVPDFDGRTALHVMAVRRRLECVVALLSHGAAVNVADAAGDCPLHVAAREGDVPIAQALVAFGADLTWCNNRGETPRHCVPAGKDSLLYVLHAVGAPRCAPGTKGCDKGCSASENYIGVAPPTPPSAFTRSHMHLLLSEAASALKGSRDPRGGRLLCLDGGGIRGMVLATMLWELEKATGRRVVDCFDWVAGTSTGGILALGLACGKTLQQCLCIYFRMKDEAFVGMRPYHSVPLETMLKDELGADRCMADIKKPRLIITSVLADRKPAELHLFRNYRSPRRLLGEEPSPRTLDGGELESPPAPEQQLVWIAARATGAAPSYFRAFGKFLDGGLAANNPTLDALTEIHEHNLALQHVGRGSEVCPVSVVVSLGTGLVPLSRMKDIDVFLPDSLMGAARLAAGITSLGALLVDQATASDGPVVDRARAWCSVMGVPYYRLTPQMSVTLAMDERQDSKLVNMLWEARAYMHEQREVMFELAALLTSMPTGRC
ncbi:85/88 kDa calcium-independent phospholipase A2 isoform X2 [Bacillus rossius redtenbacheri]|uniref:85/88 kDa calcium-independent phospholipase A2 isoform X2 n=1 Tax=Bacillus rossius redtenbacheri TaxID=93214 RepID=UPI002FDD6413